MNSVWREEHKQFIRDNASTMTDKEIAEELSNMTGRNVTMQAARKQRQKLGVKKGHGRGVCLVVQRQTSSAGIGMGVSRKI